MLGTLIKNNLKLMLRSKIIICIMLIGPFVIIAALSSAFDSMMATYEPPESFCVGYSASDDANKTITETFKKVCEENNISLVQYDNKDANEQKIFVEFKKDGYEILRTKEYENECINIEYILASIECSSNFNNNDNIEVTPNIESISKVPTASSTDYYGIIEIVYFMWCGIVTLSAVIVSEKKNRIDRKYKMASISRMYIYLGKAIPCFLANTIEILVSTVLTAVILNIHWGNIGGSVGILLLGCVAATAFGILVFYIFNNTGVVILFIFTIVWVAGFIGGTFETYMYSNFSESIKRLSPLYYMNKTLVEYSTMGHSDMTVDTIIFLLVFTLACFVLGRILMNRKMEE